MRKVSAICAVLAFIMIYGINRPNYDKLYSTSPTPIHAVATSYNDELKNKEQVNYFSHSFSNKEINNFVNYIKQKDKLKQDKYNKELYYLTSAIYQEAGGDRYSDECQLLVGNVVMNRVHHKDFAKSIYDVLTSPNQYGMMWKYGVHLPNNPNNIEKNAIARCRKNAIRILNGEKFCPSNVVYESEFTWLGDGTYKYIDGLYFNYKK